VNKPSPPFVNILIANYNYGKFLPDSLDSALNQTYKNYGIVVVDDCSTDDSWKVIHEKLFKNIPHEKKDTENFEYKIGRLNDTPVFAMRLKQNQGPSNARNFGIHETIEHTDAYLILDADDIMYPNKIERMIPYIMMSKDIGVVYADYDILTQYTGNIIRQYKEPYSKKRLMEECIVHSGSLIKSEALKGCVDQFGYYDAQLRTCEDFDLWLRISDKFMIYHVPEALTQVTVHQNDSSHSVAKQKWDENYNRVMMKAKYRYEQK